MIQIKLNPTMSNVPPLYTSVAESQISVLFALWPAVFELKAILRKVH